MNLDQYILFYRNQVIYLLLKRILLIDINSNTRLRNNDLDIVENIRIFEILRKVYFN